MKVSIDTDSLLRLRFVADMQKESEFKRGYIKCLEDIEKALRLKKD